MQAGKAESSYIAQNYGRFKLEMELHRDGNELAGPPALQRSEPGQVRKEAATATCCKCRGKARLLFGMWSSDENDQCICTRSQVRFAPTLYGGVTCQLLQS